MKVDKALALENFDRFLMEMDDQLVALKSEAAKKNIMLDFSLADFGRLETLFPLMSGGVDADTRTSLIISFARHLGEVVRINYGGKWALPLENEKNVNFNKPVIIGHTKIDGLEFSPITVMRAYALRGKPGTLQRAVDADVSPQALDLSQLVEE